MIDIDLIVVHCSFTKPHMDIGASTIRRWHVEERGFNDIGYHYVITRIGNTELGRPLEVSGAHAKGYNSNSVGICLVGGMNDAGEPDCNYTIEQFVALERLLHNLKNDHPDAVICGHRDLDTKKDCPCFDVKSMVHI